MGFTKFTKNVLNVSALPDRVQNQASSLKLVFDQAGVDIKAALNALISELEAKVAAANIGADVASVTEKNVQGILTAFENEIANRYTKAETNNAILADTNELIADVKIDLATGLLTVTKKNGTKQTFETSTEAESYAVGGTGTRPGEDTDNAKYYAQIAKQVAGGDFVTVVEMEGYAQKKGLYPNYDETELKGEVIETETTLEAESTLKVHGNSEQATRSGKNVINLENAGGWNITISNHTANSLRATINTETTASGVYCYLKKPNGDYVKTEEVLNKTLRLKCNFEKSDDTIQARFCVAEGTGSAGTHERSVQYTSGETSSVTLTSVDTTYPYVGIFLGVRRPSSTVRVGEYVDFTNVIFTIDNSDMTFEPYGAMPSPEFESPIMSVKSKSDNLFDSDYSLVTKAGFVKQSDGSYYLAKAASSNGIWENTEGYAGQMSLTGECKWINDLAGRGVVLQINYADGTIEDFMTNSPIWNKKWGVFEIVTKKGKVVQKISTSYGAGRETYFRNIMLNKGTTALSYQPYGYVPAEARIEGKNKLDLATSELGVTAPTVTGDYTRYTIINQNKLVVESLGTWNRVKCTIKDLKPNVSYTISSLIDNPNGANCGFYASSADTLYTNTAKNFKASITKNTNDNGELYFEFYTNWSNTSVTSTITYDEIQVEEGVTMTPYEQYKLTTVNIPLGDIELRSTPDGTRDTFARVDGVWNKVNKVGSVVFDGGESWNYFSGTDGKMARVFVGNSNFANASKNGVRSNKFIGANYNDFYYSQGKKFCVALSNGTTGGANRLFFTVDGKQINITTVTEWDKWVASNPITVEYLLETPTYTPITDPALISALDELEQLILHKGYNRITVTGVNGIKAYLELEISPTALTTNVTETETSTNMIVPVVSETGDVRVKIPATENQMTINPATGVVNVKGLTINGVSLDAYIRSIIG